MITLPEGVEESLSGSRVGERLQCDAWYGGALLAQDLPVTSWKIEDDSTRQVRRELSISVEDPGGDLVPLDYTDTLATGGQQIAMTHVWPTGERLTLGGMQISRSHPAASWARSTRGDLARLVCGGATVEVTARDLTDLLATADLEAPASPASGATVASELVRLADAILPVVIDPGVDASGAVNMSTVYDKGAGSRLNAMEDLAASRGAVLRMGNDGALHVEHPSTSPVWTVAGGEEGVLINVDYEMDIDELYNACVSTSSGGDVEITGRYYEASGPLRYDGPLGRRPLFHDSPLITSQQSADLDARTTLTNRVAARAIPVKVTCLDNPGLQSGDWVNLALPQDGQDAQSLLVPCQISALTRQGTSTGALPMEMTLMMTLSALKRALRGLPADSVGQ